MELNFHKIKPFFHNFIINDSVKFKFDSKILTKA
jgi:hypothetical protein